jgi:hypothetical protein
MPRRLALAVALALTSIATFGIIAVAAQTGMFGEHRPTAVQAVEQPAVAPTEPPAAPTDAPPPATPVVVTDYVYVDDPTHTTEAHVADVEDADSSATSVPASATAEATATPRPTRTPSGNAPASDPATPQSQPTAPQAEPTQPQAQPTSGTHHHEDDGGDDHEDDDD